MFGYKTKQEGTLVFEDVNSRLIFRDKTQHELFSIPYASVSQVFADTQSRQPAAASVISQVPVPYGLNLPAKFIRESSIFDVAVLRR